MICLQPGITGTGRASVSKVAYKYLSGQETRDLVKAQARGVGRPGALLTGRWNQKDPRD
jgi:hypothetical protein